MSRFYHRRLENVQSFYSYIETLIPMNLLDDIKGKSGCINDYVYFGSMGFLEEMKAVDFQINKEHTLISLMAEYLKQEG